MQKKNDKIKFKRIPSEIKKETLVTKKAIVNKRFNANKNISVGGIKITWFVRNLGIGSQNL